MWRTRSPSSDHRRSEGIWRECNSQLLPQLPDSKISKMSCFQSQMHFDDSVESTADSDLEDGELQKMLTSPLYAQKASEKPDALVVQEREVSAHLTHAIKESLRSQSSDGQKSSGKPMHCFHLSRETWPGVRCSETLIR